MTDNLKEIIIDLNSPVAEALLAMDKAGKGALVVVDNSRKVLGIITDGDVRRGFLRGITKENNVSEMMNPNPFTLPAGTPTHELLHRMNTARAHGSLNHIPIVDKEGRLVDIAVRTELTNKLRAPHQAVIMVGGLGLRLLPLTRDTPKPMLNVGDRPILERILEHLRWYGIAECFLMTYHLSDTIKDYFGDGSRLDMKLRYIQEKEQLGTAGPLRQIQDDLLSTFVVMNGDVLTDFNLTGLMATHHDKNSDMTICVKESRISVPFGVLEVDGERVIGVEEKPVVRLLINAGIYVMEPRTINYIPDKERFDMPDLITTLAKNDLKTFSYPISEYWRDIGQFSDYEQANRDISLGELPHDSK